ncbi:MAG: nucleoside triphosphate pyrophosphatase, partial [Caldimonas sp.]
DAESLEAEHAGEAPLAYVERVTRAKLHAARLRLAARGLPAAPILCADTTVALGRRIFGKPRDAAHATAMLGRLSGRTHRVITAIVLASGADEWHACSTSTVRFGAIGPLRIERYVERGEPFGKAGAYAIQSEAAGWIERIEGSYSGIMGLPLFETARLLECAGIETSPAPAAPRSADRRDL